MSRDPTGLADVRGVLRREIDHRWNAVRRIARRALAPITTKEAAPPMRPDVSPPLDVRGWLTDHLIHRVGGRDGRWLYPHLETAASRAIERVGRLTGFPSSRPVGLPPPSLPVCHLASATYLAGICADTAAAAHAAVAEGQLRHPGRGPSVRAVDRALLRGRARSRVLAEHAITQAHAQATLDALRAAGVERVGSLSEHRAIRDAELTLSAKEALYVDVSPVAGQTCANCDMFRPPRGCTLVRDPVSPAGRCEHWEEARSYEAAGILFVDPENNGLFLHRTDGAGWALPGGGIEGPETPEVAAVREGHEEVGGVPIGPLTHLTTRTRSGITFHTFRHDVQARFEPQLNHEHDDWTWAPLGEPPSPLHPGVAWTLAQMTSPEEVRDGGSPSEDHDHDVPEMACMSRDGGTFYWDRRLPRTALIADVFADVPDLLEAHEVAEFEMVIALQAAFLDGHGREPNDAERVAIYEQAHHSGGLVAEKAEASRQGVDWRKWNDWCGAKYEEIKSLPVTNPVPDPHVRPAPHDRGDYEETLDAGWEKVPRDEKGQWTGGSGDDWLKHLGFGGGKKQKSFSEWHAPIKPARLGYSEAAKPVVQEGKLAATEANHGNESWHDAPRDTEGWAKVEGQVPLDERPLEVDPFTTKTGEVVPDKYQRLASGVIIKEPDGKIWLVHPKNAFGGYLATFPKGGLEKGLSPQANAIKEAYEETGLKVKITGLLGDFRRTTSKTRYYTAERVGGNIKRHGCEMEALSLVEPKDLRTVAEHPKDAPVIDRILGMKDADPYWRSAHSGQFVTKAHHATIDPDGEWHGPDEGMFNVETAEDDRVCQVCEDISDNGPYDIDEARDLIPAHPHCRCVFIPAGT